MATMNQQAIEIRERINDKTMRLVEAMRLRGNDCPAEITDIADKISVALTTPDKEAWTSVWVAEVERALDGALSALAVTRAA